MNPPLARLAGVTLRYGDRVALDAVDLELPAGVGIGVIGPDGVGKSSMLALLAGVRRLQRGRVEVLGADLARRSARSLVRERVAYMPQGLGRNLYPTLSVADNLDFFGRVRGFPGAARTARVAALLDATGLAPFRERRVGHLSGGMKQKLGLCCALMHDPDLLVLDEPTTGIDPLSRTQFWQLIGRVRASRPGMSLLVATGDLDEAERLDWVVAMDRGRPLASGTPAELRASSAAPTLEAAFVAMVRHGAAATPVPHPSLPPRRSDGIAIEARGLTRRFGDFVAVDHVDLRIARGEIFGFIGSNGCGKTTTMKMLTGLLPPSDGAVTVLGSDPGERGADDARRRVGYMTQAFSLYRELTVRQNLALHGRLFALPPAALQARVDALVARFGLEADLDKHPFELSLGVRQRLSLAVATLHQPELLILDEPTSGVDPLAREGFWDLMTELARVDGVTLFVSTHRMNEALRCDRVALMHAGRILATGEPQTLARDLGGGSLEQAFIALIHRADPAASTRADAAIAPAPPRALDALAAVRRRALALYSYARHETMELLRDPVRATLALVGSVLLMLIMGYGIRMDVEDLRFAVLDHDGSVLSRDYAADIAASPLFAAQPPIRDDAELERRLRSGSLGVAVEIPPHFGRDAARGRASVAMWVDGAMPMRAETVDAYMQALHAQWLARRAAAPAAAPGVEVRFRYNPEVLSVVAMVPAVIPLLLMMIPAMLTALSVVREKELGSIVNFYLAPVSGFEFLVGKQLPYIALAMLNFGLLWAVAVQGFGVPFKGSATALVLAALLYVAASTALGLLMSTFLRTQTAAIFATTIGTVLPAVQFSGLINPVSSLQGAALWIGRVYPTSHFLDVCRGTFSKALGLADLGGALAALALAAPVLVVLSAAMLRKQEG